MTVNSVRKHYPSDGSVVTENSAEINWQVFMVYTKDRSFAKN
jgi:hypothetical protein